MFLALRSSSNYKVVSPYFHPPLRQSKQKISIWTDAAFSVKIKGEPQVLKLVDELIKGMF